MEVVEHELDAFRCAALQDRQERVGLVGQERDDDQIVGRVLIQRAGNPHHRPFAMNIDDRFVAFELLQAGRARTGNDRHVVSASSSQLEREGAADLPGAEDGEP